MENLSDIITSSVSIFEESSTTKSEPLFSTANGKENVLRDRSNAKEMKAASSPLKPAKKLRLSDNEILRVKRKIGNINKMGIPVQTRNPATMAKRNARERRRVQNINHTLDNLEKILPEYYVDKKDKNKKLSKLEVLRSTIDYIQTLQFVLNEDNKNNNLLIDTQMLQSFLPMHMQQQMDMSNQYMNQNIHSHPPMDLPMQYTPSPHPQTPVSDNWGMVLPPPVMTSSHIHQQPPATAVFEQQQQSQQQQQPPFVNMPPQQMTPWNSQNILWAKIFWWAAGIKPWTWWVFF